VLDVIGGGDVGLLDKNSEMVGSKTPNNLGPNEEHHFAFLDDDFLKKTYDALPT
jgi:hypothetical protein